MDFFFSTFFFFYINPIFACGGEINLLTALPCIQVKQQASKQLCLSSSLTLYFIGVSGDMGSRWGGVLFLLVWSDATSLPSGLSQDLLSDVTTVLGLLLGTLLVASQCPLCDDP